MPVRRILRFRLGLLLGLEQGSRASIFMANLPWPLTIDVYL